MNVVKRLAKLSTVLLVASVPAFAGEAASEQDIISSYLAKKQLVASENLAASIERTGKTECYIAFLQGTDEISPESRAQIRELAALLLEDNDLKIEVSFQSKDLGTETSAPKMAHKRALALASALRDLNVQAGRVVAKSSNDPVSVAFNDLVRRL